MSHSADSLVPLSEPLHFLCAHTHPPGTAKAPALSISETKHTQSKEESASEQWARFCCLFPGNSSWVAIYLEVTNTGCCLASYLPFREIDWED